MYDRLEYRGNARGLVVTIPPSRARIEITKDNPYIFKEYDLMTEDAINYYKSLRSAGLVLVKKDGAVLDNAQEDNTESSEVVEDTVEVDEDSVNTDNDSVEDTVDDSTQDEDEEEEEVVEDTTDTEEEEVTDPVEIDEGVIQELFEYLDMNYDDESIVELASAADVALGRLRKKESIISKILEDNPQYVLELVSR